jgi:HEAT repeat protein
MLQLEMPREVWKRIKGYTKPQKVFPTNHRQILCWKAVRLKDRQPVVIKLFDWDIIEEVNPELKAVGELKNINHPHLVSVYDIGQTDDGVYYVMEYWGDDLRELMLTPPHPDWVVGVITEVLKGLAELHLHHFVHRDIKLENIYIKNDQVKIGDYGLVKSKRWMTVLKTIAGTRGYMAPEVLAGKPYDKRCDIYSVGVVLRELLTTFHYGRVSKSSDLYQDIIRKSTAQKPDARFNSAGEFLKAIQNIRAPGKKTDNRMISIPQERLQAVIDEAVHLIEKSDIWGRRHREDSVRWVFLSVRNILGLLGVKEAVPKLTPLLKHHDAQVRETVLLILGDLPDKKSIPEIIPLLNDQSSGVRAMAVLALRAIGDKKVVPHIRQLLKDADSGIRSIVIDALIRLDPEGAVNQIIPFLKDPDVLVRDNAAFTLCQLKAKASIPYLIPLLKDTEFLIRRDTVSMLRKLKAREFTADIIPLLKDADFTVREDTVLALCELAGQKAIPYLLPLLNDPEAGVRQRVCFALAYLGARQTRARIIPLLKDPDALMRLTALDTLGRFAAKEAGKEIIPLLKDTDVRVRGTACFVLAKLKTKDAIPEIVPLLNDASEQIRGAAAIALAELDALPKLPPKVIPYIKLFSGRYNPYKTRAQRALKKLSSVRITK